MTQTAAVFTVAADSIVAGQDLGRQIRDALKARPDVVIVFASARFDHEALLKALADLCQPHVMVGSSSAAEFAGEQRAEGSACALAVCSSEMKFASGLGVGVSRDRVAASRNVVAGFTGIHSTEYPYRAALVMTDAVAGHAEDLIEQLAIATAGGYDFAGCGTGDDAQVGKTHVFHGTRAVGDAVVALEVLSAKPLGIGVKHGWTPASDPLRVTEVDGARLISLDGFPAVEAFEQHANRTHQQLDRAAPLPYFLHNILGIDTPSGHRLRVPLSAAADGSVTCAAEIPHGARIHIMAANAASASEAAADATRSSINMLRGNPPAAALLFDCVATRTRLGDNVGSINEAVLQALGGTDLVGCNTNGQIARAEGQFGGFHNCTAVVFTFPK